MNVIFGTGVRAENLLYVDDIGNIDYFIDNNPEKIGKEFYGYEVKTPDEMDTTITKVIISSQKYATEMKRQLLKLGINENKIFIHGN